jgi:hypothetical protein
MINRMLQRSAIVSALYVLSGARGGTTRAINALSVSVGYQISSRLAGASEHVLKIAIRRGGCLDFAYVPDCDILVKGKCVIEHIRHVGDIRDIPTLNILVKDISRTAFNSRPSDDV